MLYLGGLHGITIYLVTGKEEGGGKEREGEQGRRWKTQIDCK
jgi:hypothetical protein